MKVYYNKAIKALVIYSNGYALILRDNTQGKCFIEFIPESQLPPIDEFIDLVNSPLFGFLGLITFKGVIYAGFITDRRLVGDLLEDQNIYQICDTIFINFKGEIASYYKSYNDDVNGDYVGSGIHSITKLLASGTFYYSPETDLSLSMKDRTLIDPNNNITQPGDYSTRFIWNNGLIHELCAFRLRMSKNERSVFDRGLFYITITRGYIDQRIIERGKLMIISRQGNKNSGALFGPTGMDDEGNVANFVETEVILQLDDVFMSYLLVRGNVPLFWKLDAHLIYTKLEFPRSEDATKHAFTRFFETLCSQYGKVFVLDALSARGSQPELRIRYYNAILDLHKNSPELPVSYKSLYDSKGVHKQRENENYSKILMEDEQALNELNNHGSLVLQLDTKKIVAHQIGIIFVSSLFSIDRSNFLMSKVSEYYLQRIFEKRGPIPDDLWFSHYELWQANGSTLNKLADGYNASIKTKNKTGGLIGKVAEQSKKYVTSSISTGVSNTGRQRQLDRLLGGKNKELQVDLLDPVHDYVMCGLKARSDEYRRKKNLSIYCVTYNVNAVVYDGDLEQFLFPEKEEFSKYDLVVVSLEEVIELTPSKVMAIDPTIRRHWEKKLNDTLNSSESANYSLIRAEQLGGVLLLVYSNSETTEYIKNIETAVKKTGFKGMSANKGGVAISFDFSTHSRLCFVGSHLAAGHDHLLERHADYKTLSKGLKFSKNKNISDSDILIWMGDMNYRIQLPNHLVRKMLNCKSPLLKPVDIKNEINETLDNNSGIKEEYDDDYVESSGTESVSMTDDYIKDETVIDSLLSDPDDEETSIVKLFEFDQLNSQMNSGKTFPFFDEMEIKFLPTYKFDKGTDIYDTSEKQRTPSWTDRILTYGKNKEVLQPIRYNSIPTYKFSDHKPVYGIFVANLEIINEQRKQEIEQELYEIRKNELGNGSILTKSYKELEEDIKIGSVLKHGLPPPSGKVNRWWRSNQQEDNGIDLKKSKIEFPELDNGGFIINPNLPTNPFIKTDEPDFITAT